MKTLVVFALTDYAGIVTRQQHIINRLTDDYKVIWINPPQRSTSVFLSRHTFGAITVITPVTTQMKTGYSTEQISVMVKMLKRYITGPVDMWFFDPAAEPMIDQFQVEKVTYDVTVDCVARGSYIDVRQNRLFARADLLVCESQQLKTHYGLSGAHVLPNGVTAGFFDPLLVEMRESLSCGTMPGVLLEIPGTRIGYVGTIDKRIDFHLVDELARLNPHIHVVMVGPVVDVNPVDLPTRRNIHYVGALAYGELPSALHSFSVGIIPYVVSPTQGRMQPVKALEYLAGGVPCVTTTNAPLHDLTDLVTSATRTEFAAAVIAAVGVELPMDEVDQLTSTYDWDKLVDESRPLLV